MNDYFVSLGAIALTLLSSRSAAQTAVATSLKDLQAFSSCLAAGSESFKFLLFNVSLGFDDAKSFCASLANLDDPALNAGLTNPSFFLARVSNNEERTQLLILLNAQVPRVADRNNFWIGLKDENNVGGIDPSVRFLHWVDGTTEGLDQTFIGVTQGAFPWDGGQPNDLNANQNCVRWNAGSNLLDDQICSQNNAVLCRVECGPNAFIPSTAPTHGPAFVVNVPTSSPLSKEDQIAKIAGSSVLSIVGIFLILGVIYGIKSIYTEKKSWALANASTPKQPDVQNFQIHYLSPSNEMIKYSSPKKPKDNIFGV